MNELYAVFLLFLYSLVSLAKALEENGTATIPKDKIITINYHAFDAALKISEVKLMAECKRQRCVTGEKVAAFDDANQRQDQAIKANGDDIKFVPNPHPTHIRPIIHYCLSAASAIGTWQ